MHDLGLCDSPYQEHGVAQLSVQLFLFYPYW